MNKVKNIISLKIDEEIEKSCNFYCEIQKNHISLSKSIKNQKILNYKLIQSSLSEVISSLKKCEKIQGIILEKSEDLSQQTGKIFDFLKNYSKNVFICEDLKNSHEIIELILKRFSLVSPKSLNFQELIENLNNLDLLQDEVSFEEIHTDYINQVNQIEKRFILEVCRRIKTLVFDLESLTSPSLVKFAFDLIYKKDPEKYQNLVTFTSRIRKRQTFIKVLKIKHLDFCNYLESLVDLVKTENKKISAIFGNDAEEMISKTFSDFFKNLPKLVEKQVLSFNFFELFSCLQSVEEVKEFCSLSSLDKLKEMIENRINFHSRHSTECVSGLAGLEKTSGIFYVRFKVAELLLAFKKLRFEPVIRYFFQVCFEIIDRVVGYFFDLSSLKGMVNALNVYELVLDSFREYPSHLRENIRDIKERIVLSEVSMIFSQIHRFSADFSHSFLNFYYKAASCSVLSQEINEIQSETSKSYVKSEISRMVLQKSAAKLALGKTSVLLKPYLLQLLLV